MLRSWLQTRSKPKVGRPRDARRRLTARLRLERFEERTVPTFNPTNYAAGAGAAAVATADFQGAGGVDFAVANIQANNVSVFLNHNDGSGTFATAVNYAVGAAPVDIATGDLDGDGLPDIVVTNAGGTTATVLFNNPASPGTFLPAVTLQLGGTAPRDVRLADLNGDGFLDIITADYGSNQVSVLLNNGDGTFAAAHTYTAGAGNGTYALAIADFNGDGNLDVAVGNPNSGITILNGNGDGTLQPFHTVAAPGLVTGLAAGDLGNGAQDLVSANNNTGTVSVLINDGSGNFSAATNYPIGANALRVIMADVNGDGNQDVVIDNFTSSNPGTIRILYGNGDGTLQAAQVLNSGGNQPSAVAAADLEGDSASDGRSDLVVTNFASGNVTVLINTPAPIVVSTTLTGSRNPPLSDGQIVFSDPIDPNTFTPDQFVLTDPNGNPVNVTGVNALDGTNTRFDITFDSQSTLGTYTLSVGPNILDATDQFTVPVFNSSFSITNDLIVNGGFENGDTGWVDNNSVQTSGFDGIPAHTGTHFLALGAVGSDAATTQRVTTVPGQTYDLRFFYYSDGGTPSDLNVSWNGTVVYTEVNAAFHSWVQHDITVTGTGSDLLSIAGRNDPTWDGIDDVSLTPGTAPSPGGGPRTLASVATGLTTPGLSAPVPHQIHSSIVGLRTGDLGVQSQPAAQSLGTTGLSLPSVAPSGIALGQLQKSNPVTAGTPQSATESHIVPASAAATSDPLGVNLLQGVL